jgi:hypothetical protein
MYAGIASINGDFHGESAIDLLTEKLADLGFDAEVVEDEKGLRVKFHSSEYANIPPFITIKIPIETEEAEDSNDFVDTNDGEM